MSTKEIKIYSLAEMKDKYIGKVGTNERDEYKYELRMDVDEVDFKQRKNLVKLTSLTQLNCTHLYK